MNHFFSKYFEKSQMSGSSYFAILSIINKSVCILQCRQAGCAARASQSHFRPLLFLNTSWTSSCFGDNMINGAKSPQISGRSTPHHTPSKSSITVWGMQNVFNHSWSHQNCLKERRTRWDRTVHHHSDIPAWLVVLHSGQNLGQNVQSIRKLLTFLERHMAWRSHNPLFVYEDDEVEVFTLHFFASFLSFGS